MKRLHYFLAKRWVLSNGLKITVNLFKSNLLLLYFILSSYTVLGCFVMQNIFFSFLLGIKFIDWKHELGSCNLLFLRIFWGVILFGCWENGVGKESDFRKESENTWATLCLENVIPKSIQTRSEVSHNYYKQWPSSNYECSSNWRSLDSILVCKSCIHDVKVCCSIVTLLLQSSEITPSQMARSCKVAVDSVNVNKNRYLDVVPCKLMFLNL
jgi:hypothetical protein